MNFENTVKSKRDLFLNGYKSLWIFAPSGSELQFWFEIIDHLQDSEVRPVLKRLEDNHDFNNPNAHKPGIAQLKRAVAQVKTELGAKNAFNGTGRKVQQWEIDVADKLGISVNQLPSHARFLTDEQRKILDIPKYWRFVKNLNGVPIKVEFSETPFPDSEMEITKAMLSEERRITREEAVAWL